MHPRILGIETEYGLLARTRTGGRPGRLSPAEAAQWLFRPIEREHASSNIFLRNGGRLYLDVGSHPEYATPECRDVAGLLVHERAGDELVTRLAERAMQEAAAEGHRLDLRLFKNNVDSHLNSYGSHENYSVPRDLDLPRLAEELTSFLVTRQVLCGSGHWTPDGFRISQRAEHLHELLSATTTRTRPLINTRDEPLADPQRFRRLHVIAGDSNLSEPTAQLKLATTLLVLAEAERAARGQPHRLPSITLAEPAVALRDTSRDPHARLALAGGGTMGALEVQRAHAEAVTPDDSGTIETWIRVLDGIDADAFDLLAHDVEWVAKRQLLERFAGRHQLAWNDRRLAALDLAFHDLGSTDTGPRGLFRLLERAGAVRRITEPAEVERALTAPPADTRAALRSRLIAQAQASGRDYSVDWVGFSVHDLPVSGVESPEVSVRLDDPFAVTDEAAERLLERLRVGWTPSRQL